MKGSFLYSFLVFRYTHICAVNFRLRERQNNCRNVFYQEIRRLGVFSCIYQSFHNFYCMYLFKPMRTLSHLILSCVHSLINPHFILLNLSNGGSIALMSHLLMLTHGLICSFFGCLYTTLCFQRNNYKFLLFYLDTKQRA